MTTAATGRLLALIPAAGRSRRMGQPKLLLRLDEQTVIDRLVRVLTAAGVDRILVLVRPDDVPLQQELRSLNCETVIAGREPAEMRDSVELLLQHANRTCHPGNSDHWLLIPADHPFVEAATIQQLQAESVNHPDKIILPVYHGRRGHPTLFPWPVAQEVPQIPGDKGLNWLVRQDATRVLEVEVTQASILFDLDTPEDFEHAQQLAESRKDSRSARDRQESIESGFNL